VAPGTIRVPLTSALPSLTPEVLARAVAVRVVDVRFVLDQLAALNAGRNPDAEHRRLPRGLRGALDLSRVGMFGFSSAARPQPRPRPRTGASRLASTWTAPCSET
jgi:hypothetical protein